MKSEGILLESGTNEVEVLEFILKGQSFGVNVLKIQAIEQFDPSRLTRIQLAHPAIVGTLLFRNQCITLVDLGHHLDGEAADPEEAWVANPEGADEPGTENAHGEKLVLVMEFNDLKTAFLVDGVNRIHRASWESINTLSPFLNTPDTKFTGSLNVEDNEILIVDMEKVVSEILPMDLQKFMLEPDQDHPNFAARAGVQVFLAEDSATIREMLVKELHKGNYQQVRTFPNGAECFQAINELQRTVEADGGDLRDHLRVVISDIEMPKMDGLALCRSCKKDLHLDGLPFIMFSSLINDQIAHKCDEVGADAYLSKPQFTRLVELLDQYCLD